MIVELTLRGLTVRLRGVSDASLVDYSADSAKFDSIKQEMAQFYSHLSGETPSIEEISVAILSDEVELEQT